MKLLCAGTVKPQPVTETLDVQIRVSKRLTFTRRIVRMLRGPCELPDEPPGLGGEAGRV